MKVDKDLARKHLHSVEKYKPCPLSVTFLRRLELKIIVVILVEIYILRVTDLVESYVSNELIQLYLSELYWKTFEVLL